jgi:NADH-quinone oxidoreductase subunit N
MIQSWSDLMPILPEVAMLIAALTLMLLEAFLSERNRHWLFVCAMASLLGVAFLITIDFSYGAQQRLLDGMLVRDALGDVLKLFLLLATAIVFVYARHFFSMRRQFFGNFYVLSLFAVLGMMVLVSAGNLVTIYLGLELMALATYTLVALDRDNGTSTEAAMKYFVLGAIASGLLLYGMSLLFGVTGSLDLREINQKLFEIATGDQGKIILMAFALTFIIIGLAFKFGAVPFHMWLPDVYEGAPTAVVAFIASVPKLAALGMAFRLLTEGLHVMQPRWQEMLALLTIGSLLVGNLAALAQYNLKRLMAYSTISHVGFIFLGLLNGGAQGYSAVLFYTIVYALTTAAAFGVIMSFSREGLEFDKIDDFKGLNKRSPWMAFLMLLVMASLAGIPPLVGFWAKLQVIMAAVALGKTFAAVVLIAAICAVIGAFYYLKVIKAMYFDAPESDVLPLATVDVRWVLACNTLVVVVLGVYWAPLAAVCNAVFMHR